MSSIVSILVLTKNEEQDLPECLESVRWSDDVHVYDSFSEDRTLDIAEKFGAKITQRGFDDWSTHQNWGLKNIQFAHPWVFYVDADERVTTPLQHSIENAVSSGGPFVAFRVTRRDFLDGRWLRFNQASPFFVRLFRPEKIRYERLVNPISVVDGPVGDLMGYLDHFPFSKGMSHWLARHNSYSSFEARQIIENRRAHTPFSVPKAFFCRDVVERRYHQKELFYRLPCRPLVKFLLLYGLKGGFLCGRAGLTYATLQAFYETMIVLKTRELMRSEPD